MTFEIDPDLWLFTRLTTQRWRWAPMAVLSIYAFVMMSDWPFPPPSSPAFTYGSANLAFISLFVLIVTGWSPVPTFAATERAGLFDWTRLCGRPPRRVLLMLVAGVMWPYLLIVAVMLGVNRVVFHGGPAVLWLAAGLFVTTLDVALVVLRWLPASPSPTLLFGLAVWPAATGVVAIMFSRWDQIASAFTWPRQMAALLVLVTLPFAIRMASRRLARSANRANRRRLGDLNLSAIGLGVVIVVAAIAIAVTRWTPAGLNAYLGLLSVSPDIAVFVGGLAVLAGVQQEVESGTIDLLRLTPQAPHAVALG